MQIDKGRRIKLSDLFQGSPRFDAALSAVGQGLSIDFACFGLNAAGKLHSDPYMTFFNQPTTPCGAVNVAATPSVGATTTMNFDLDRLPADVDRLVLTAAIDGSGAMSQLSSGFVALFNAGREVGKFAFTGSDFAAERALMLGEFYRKDGAWRFNAIGQGFNGGLDALVQHFGGDVAAPAPAAPVVSAAAKTQLNLEKRVAAEAPQLINLVKKASVSLEKVGLSEHRAKVCLVLDISYSMEGLYTRNMIQEFAERILALGCRFDDDGEIDVFLFGNRAHQAASMTLSNCSKYVRDILKIHDLEGGTNYGMVMEKIRQFYCPQNNGANTTCSPTKMALPVYAMFLTDGQTSNERFAESQVRAASFEPIFWQFMGIGPSYNFDFLEKLDDLKNRFLDNADFFSVTSPQQHTDDKLYDLLMAEYPSWLKQAKAKGLLPA